MGEITVIPGDQSVSSNGSILLLGEPSPSEMVTFSTNNTSSNGNALLLSTTSKIKHVIHFIQEFDPSEHPRGPKGMFVDAPDKLNVEDVAVGDVIVDENGNPYQVINNDPHDSGAVVNIIDPNTGEVTSQETVLNNKVEVGRIEAALPPGKQKPLREMPVGQYVERPTDGKRFLVAKHTQKSNVAPHWVNGLADSIHAAKTDEIIQHDDFLIGKYNEDGEVAITLPGHDVNETSGLTPEEAEQWLRDYFEKGGYADQKGAVTPQEIVQFVNNAIDAGTESTWSGPWGEITVESLPDGIQLALPEHGFTAQQVTDGYNIYFFDDFETIPEQMANAIQGYLNDEGHMEKNGYTTLYEVDDQGATIGNHVVYPDSYAQMVTTIPKVLTAAEAKEQTEIKEPPTPRRALATWLASKDWFNPTEESVQEIEDAMDLAGIPPYTPIDGAPEQVEGIEDMTMGWIEVQRDHLVEMATEMEMDLPDMPSDTHTRDMVDRITTVNGKEWAEYARRQRIAMEETGGDLDPARYAIYATADLWGNDDALAQVVPTLIANGAMDKTREDVQRTQDDILNWNSPTMTNGNSPWIGIAGGYFDDGMRLNETEMQAPIPPDQEAYFQSMRSKLNENDLPGEAIYDRLSGDAGNAPADFFGSTIDDPIAIGEWLDEAFYLEAGDGPDEHASEQMREIAGEYAIAYRAARNQYNKDLQEYSKSKTAKPPKVIPPSWNTYEVEGLEWLRDYLEQHDVELPPQRLETVYRKSFRNRRQGFNNDPLQDMDSGSDFGRQGEYAARNAIYHTIRDLRSAPDLSVDIPLVAGPAKEDRDNRLQAIRIAYNDAVENRRLQVSGGPMAEKYAALPNPPKRYPPGVGADTEVIIYTEVLTGPQQGRDTMSSAGIGSLALYESENTFQVRRVARVTGENDELGDRPGQLLQSFRTREDAERFAREQVAEHEALRDVGSSFELTDPGDREWEVGDKIVGKNGEVFVVEEQSPEVYWYNESLTIPMGTQVNEDDAAEVAHMESKGYERKEFPISKIRSLDRTSRTLEVAPSEHWSLIKIDWENDPGLGPSYDELSEAMSYLEKQQDPDEGGGIDDTGIADDLFTLRLEGMSGEFADESPYISVVSNIEDMTIGSVGVGDVAAAQDLIDGYVREGKITLQKKMGAEWYRDRIRSRTAVDVFSVQTIKDQDPDAYISELRSDWDLTELQGRTVPDALESLYRLGYARDEEVEGVSVFNKIGERFNLTVEDDLVKRVDRVTSNYYQGTATAQEFHDQLEELLVQLEDPNADFTQMDNPTARAVESLYALNPENDPNIEGRESHSRQIIYDLAVRRFYQIGKEDTAEEEVDVKTDEEYRAEIEAEPAFRIERFKVPETDAAFQLYTINFADLGSTRFLPIRNNQYTDDGTLDDQTLYGLHMLANNEALREMMKTGEGPGGMTDWGLTVGDWYGSQDAPQEMRTWRDLPLGAVGSIDGSDRMLVKQTAVGVWTDPTGAEATLDLDEYPVKFGLRFSGPIEAAQLLISEHHKNVLNQPNRLYPSADPEEDDGPLIMLDEQLNNAEQDAIDALNAARDAAKADTRRKQEALRTTAIRNEINRRRDLEGTVESAPYRNEWGITSWDDIEFEPQTIGDITLHANVVRDMDVDLPVFFTGGLIDRGIAQVSSDGAYGRVFAVNDEHAIMRMEIAGATRVTNRIDLNDIYPYDGSGDIYAGDMLLLEDEPGLTDRERIDALVDETQQWIKRVIPESDTAIIDVMSSRVELVRTNANDPAQAEAFLRSIVQQQGTALGAAHSWDLQDHTAWVDSFKAAVEPINERGKPKRIEYVPHDQDGDRHPDDRGLSTGAPTSQRGQLRLLGYTPEEAIKRMQELGFVHELEPEVPYKAIMRSPRRYGRVRTIHSDYLRGDAEPPNPRWSVSHGITGGLPDLHKVLATGALMSIAERNRLGIRSNSSTSEKGDVRSGIDFGLFGTQGQSSWGGGHIVYFKDSVYLADGPLIAPRDFGGSPTRYQDYTDTMNGVRRDVGDDPGTLYDPLSPAARKEWIEEKVDVAHASTTNSSGNEWNPATAVPVDDWEILRVTDRAERDAAERRFGEMMRDGLLTDPPVVITNSEANDATNANNGAAMASKPWAANVLSTYGPASRQRVENWMAQAPQEEEIPEPDWDRVYTTALETLGGTDVTGKGDEEYVVAEAEPGDYWNVPGTTYSIEVKGEYLPGGPYWLQVTDAGQSLVGEDVGEPHLDLVEGGDAMKQAVALIQQDWKQKHPDKPEDTAVQIPVTGLDGQWKGELSDDVIATVEAMGPESTIATVSSPIGTWTIEQTAPGHYIEAESQLVSTALAGSMEDAQSLNEPQEIGGTGYKIEWDTSVDLYKWRVLDPAGSTVNSYLDYVDHDTVVDDIVDDFEKYGPYPNDEGAKLKVKDPSMKDMPWNITSPYAIAENIVLETEAQLDDAAASIQPDADQAKDYTDVVSIVKVLAPEMAKNDVAIAADYAFSNAHEAELHDINLPPYGTFQIELLEGSDGVHDAPDLLSVIDAITDAPADGSTYSIGFGYSVEIETVDEETDILTLLDPDGVQIGNWEGESGTSDWSDPNSDRVQTVANEVMSDYKTYGPYTDNESDGDSYYDLYSPNGDVLSGGLTSSQAIDNITDHINGKLRLDLMDKKSDQVHAVIDLVKTGTDFDGSHWIEPMMPQIEAALNNAEQDIPLLLPNGYMITTDINNEASVWRPNGTSLGAVTAEPEYLYEIVREDWESNGPYLLPNYGLPPADSPAAKAVEAVMPVNPGAPGQPNVLEVKENISQAVQIAMDSGAGDNWENGPQTAAIPGWGSYEVTVAPDYHPEPGAGDVTSNDIAEAMTGEIVNLENGYAIHPITPGAKSTAPHYVNVINPLGNNIGPAIGADSALAMINSDYQESGPYVISAGTGTYSLYYKPSASQTEFVTSVDVPDMTEDTAALETLTQGLLDSNNAVNGPIGGVPLPEPQPAAIAPANEGLFPEYDGGEEDPNIKPGPQFESNVPAKTLGEFVAGQAYPMNENVHVVTGFTGDGLPIIYDNSGKLAAEHGSPSYVPHWKTSEHQGPGSTTKAVWSVYHKNGYSELPKNWYHLLRLKGFDNLQIENMTVAEMLKEIGLE